MATHSTGLNWLRHAFPLVCGGWFLVAAIPCGAQHVNDEAPIDFVMFHDPPLQLAEPTRVLPAGLKELWLKALARPDAELRRLAADSFALARERGMEDLDDLHAVLAELLQAPDQDLGVQRAAVHTLIALDASEHAPLLANAAQTHGLSLAVLVEPALARWKSDLLRDTWLARIDDPGAIRISRLLAIESLGTIEATAATKSLTRIVNDPALGGQERTAAARALSQIGSPDLVDVAAKLASEPAPLLHAVLAMELMQREARPPAVTLLKQLAAHPNTAVQVGALRRLYAIDPRHVYEFAETAIASEDAGVRTVGANALIVQKQLALIAPLASLLDDVNPTLRMHVAKSLVQLASEADLHAEVIKQATTVLQRDQWRGLEQAAVVLLLLDHKPAGDRLVELLSHERGEVTLAAGWGLRRLALPEHLPAMLAHAQQGYDDHRAGVKLPDVPQRELKIAQLFMAFGQMRFREAEPLMMLYVPKDHSLGTMARAAAVWSVGWLNEGAAPQELTTALIARLADVMSLDPETDEVRRMSAVSIGRMKSEFAAPTIKKLVVTDGGYPRRASYWAIEQLTGEVAPPPDPINVSFNDWFLVPVR